MKGIFMRGFKKKYRQCIICKSKIEAYEQISLYFKTMQEQHNYYPGPPETCNTKEYLCPICHSSDRDRLCVAFLERLFKKNKDRKAKLLHIAPAEPINKAIREKFPGISVKNMDLYMENMDYALDIQNMGEIQDGEFDLWICFHVLEHVESDIRAMKELKRILNDKGLGILLVPIDLAQKETDEAWGLSEEENWRRFGQGDHVRKYEKSDFIARLRSVGFHVHELNKHFFGSKVFQENAFTSTTTLYIVDKCEGEMNIRHLIKRFHR